jgi:hypothetical protein
MCGNNSNLFIVIQRLNISCCHLDIELVDCYMVIICNLFLTSIHFIQMSHELIVNEI